MSDELELSQLPTTEKSKIEEMIDVWREGVIGDDVEIPESAYMRGILHERWNPKWRWVRPLLGWIGFKWFVRWAYKIDRTLFTDCYPISIKTGLEVPMDEDVSYTIDFTGHPYTSEAIQKKVDELNERFHEGKA